MLKSLSKPMQFLLVGALALVAFALLQPMLSPAPAPKTAKKMLPAKPKAKSEEIYTKEDLTAHFDSANQDAKDSFKPEIIKVGTSGGKTSQVNLVPVEFAGGEANWTYTGSAEIDGVLQALLENKTTGEDVFLKVGDTWKGISVEEITDDSLLLASVETGTEKKLELPPDTTTAGPAGFAPVRAPVLQGDIGQMSIQPDGSTIQPDPNGGATAPAMDSGTGNTGRSRGRGRGRGRSRGGGGYGG
ncbi:MAG TPA: hypothetical protein VHE55_17915 [Fimbriimonadaceae bacterium]|nr:hypothetical protein [Fimbriimonadaceae bacterium]